MTSAYAPNGITAELIAKATSWRRHLHRHPELAFKERATADFIADRLAESGLRLHRGLGGTGIVGTLSRGTSKRTIAIRAEMDALPILERNEVPHSSQHPGVMHACGHDGHMAIALAAAQACADMQDLDGTVHFIFQPAEENEGGARRMVEDGLFRLFPTDSIYALHNWPTLPVGTCVVREGPIMAALSIFEIEVSGLGCHGALPHEGTDSVLASCNLVTSIQSIVSRNIDPRDTAVISVTQIRGGDGWNIIPGSCILRGTARWFDSHVGDAIERRLTELSSWAVSAFGCTATVRYERRFPATINDATITGRVREVVSAPPLELRLLDTKPSTGSEDFSFMSQEVPGCYLLLGAACPQNCRLHSPHYDFNDALLPLGAQIWVSLVRRHLVSP